MKKLCVVLSLILCFTLCVNLMPVYGTAVSSTEGTEQLEPADTTTPTDPVTPTDPATPAEPELPLEITATVGKDAFVTINWNAENAEHVYAIMRAATVNGTYENIGNITGIEGEAAYTDTVLLAGECRYYKVAQLEGNEVIKESEPCCVKMNFQPPAGVKTALANGKHVKITWNKVANVTGYKVFRSTSKNGTYKLIKTVKTTYCTDKNVSAGKVYYYKVRAYKDGVDSVKSDLSTAVAYYMKPAAPTITTKNNNGNINISWKKVAGAEKYYVYIYSNKQSKYIKVGESTKLTYTHKKALKNAFLYYKVRAVYQQDGNTIKGNLSQSSKVLSRYVNPNKKMVALTFDDGPSKYTKAIVNCLFKYDSAATFFVVGSRVDGYKDTLSYTYNRGNEIGNHSYDHPILTGLSAEKIKQQINKTDNKVKNVIGVRTDLVRVPGGGYNSKVKKAVGKPIIQWSDDTLDWKTRSKKATVDYVMKNVSDGDIILMHDLHEPTKNAALELIPKLRNKGYQIVTVSEMAKYKGYKMKKGTVYFSFR